MKKMGLIFFLKFFAVGISFGNSERVHEHRHSVLDRHNNNLRNKQKATLLQVISKNLNSRKMNGFKRNVKSKTKRLRKQSHPDNSSGEKYCPNDYDNDSVDYYSQCYMSQLPDMSYYDAPDEDYSNNPEEIPPRISYSNKSYLKHVDVFSGTEYIYPQPNCQGSPVSASGIIFDGTKRIGGKCIPISNSNKFEKLSTHGQCWTLPGGGVEVNVFREIYLDEKCKILSNIVPQEKYQLPSCYTDDRDGSSVAYVCSEVLTSFNAIKGIYQFDYDEDCGNKNKPLPQGFSLRVASTDAMYEGGMEKIGVNCSQIDKTLTITTDKEYIYPMSELEYFNRCLLSPDTNDHNDDDPAGRKYVCIDGSGVIGNVKPALMIPTGLSDDDYDRNGTITDNVYSWPEEYSNNGNCADDPCWSCKATDLAPGYPKPYQCRSECVKASEGAISYDKRLLENCFPNAAVNESGTYTQSNITTCPSWLENLFTVEQRNAVNYIPVEEKCGDASTARYGSDVPMFGIDFMSAVNGTRFLYFIKFHCNSMDGGAKIEREHRDSISWEMFDDINCTVPESV